MPFGCFKKKETKPVSTPETAPDINRTPEKKRSGVGKKVVVGKG
jgi:hypothetical protein